MSFRLVPCLLVLSSAVAVADDEMVLTPVCAEVDPARDTFGETERELAKAQLARVLQDLDLLVVEHDCVEHYVLSHELQNGDFSVRLAGPGGVRRVRNPERAELQLVYDRMVTSLIDAQVQETRVATVEPTDSTYANAIEAQPDIDAVPPDPASPVRLDAVLYGQLTAGNYGTGAGLGLRIPVSAARAFDLSLSSVSDGGRQASAFGAKLVHYVSPESPTTPYLGAGLAVATHSTEMAESSGARLDASAGLMMNRTGSTRMFMQVDLGLPLFAIEGGYEPSITVSFGVGR